MLRKLTILNQLKRLLAVVHQSILIKITLLIRISPVIILVVQMILSLQGQRYKRIILFKHRLFQKVLLIKMDKIIITLMVKNKLIIS